MDKKITSLENGVKVFFSGEDVKKDNIIEMVENCKRGKCDCMSEDMKTKITDMHISGEDKSVNLHITGDIKEQDIKDAMDKSNIINTNCSDGCC